MTFSFDETDDFDDEPQESYLDEEDADAVDLEEDLEDPDTALSHAFREASVVEVVEEEDEDEDEDETEDSEEEEEAPEVVEVAEEQESNNDTEAYEQRLAEAIDALTDDEDLEVVIPPLELPSLAVEVFRPQEQNNLAYTDAVRAYHEEQDYQRAIEKFGDAIENETQHMEGNVTDSNSIVAKAMYWQAEAYVKLQDIPQAIVVFESLIQGYQEHYLSLAAQRRTAQLSPEDS